MCVLVLVLVCLCACVVYVWFYVGVSVSCDSQSMPLLFVECYLEISLPFIQKCMLVLMYACVMEFVVSHVHQKCKCVLRVCTCACAHVRCVRARMCVCVRACVCVLDACMRACG